VATTVSVYERMLGEAAGLSRAGLAEVGAGVGGVLEARWPDLVRELEGMAAGAGQPVELLLAVNARTELLAGTAAAECSLAAALAGPGGCRVAQTWDWHPALAGAWVLWRVHLPGGRWFATLTEAGILAKLGMAGTGLCCGLNFLSCSADRGVGGVPIHVLLRLLLDRCATLEAALALLRGTPVGASSCVTLGWAPRGGRPALVAAELSPGGCRVVRPDGDGRLFHTNHFLAGPPEGEDLEPARSPGTLGRLEALRAGADLRSHAGAPEAICRHDDGRGPWPERRRTLAAVVMEPGVPRLRVAAGLPCAEPFAEVAL
jgi:isopenicillin-N N-acyltransferase-like protein